MKGRITFTAILIVSAMQATLGAQPTLHERSRYLLRPGDILRLDYRLTPEFNQSITVQPDGYIDANVGGEIYVSGLTISQVHDLIVERDKARLKDPELSLSLEEFTRPYVVVAGEVYKPGQIEVRDKMTALSAILMAGGFTNSARSGQVIVFRKLNDSFVEVKQLNLTRVHKTPQLERDLALEAGDMVLVPHDRISRIQHFISAANLGMYVNPLQTAP